MEQNDKGGTAAVGATECMAHFKTSAAFDSKVITPLRTPTLRPIQKVGCATYWHVNTPHNTYITTRDVTWGDIQKCIGELNESGSDVFAGLHRCEGGFMCVEGPGFKSNEPVDTHTPHQNPAIEGDSIVHKEIRFKVGGCCHWPHWPSSNYSFLRNPLLTDDWIVMGKGSKMGFAFTGGYCTPWGKDECKRYSILLSNLLECKARNSVKRKR